MTLRLIPVLSQPQIEPLEHLKNQIHQYIGNAIDIIPTIEEKFDLVFIDADKSNYINYLIKLDNLSIRISTFVLRN